MHTIRRCSFGFELTLSGRVGASEMKHWHQDADRWLAGTDEPFDVLIDATRCKALSRQAPFWLLRGQQVLDEAGLRRVAVLWTAPLGLRLGVPPDDRRASSGRMCYIRADELFPRTRALCWLLSGIDPGREGGGTLKPPMHDSAPPEADRAA